MRCFIAFFYLFAAVFSFAEDGLLDTLTKQAGGNPPAVDSERDIQAVMDGVSPVPPQADGTPPSAEDETFDGDFDEKEFWENYEGPDIKVIYDERSEIDYVIVQTDSEYTEFHYLDHIGYSDLMFVLTDLLRRITNEGYIYASNIMTEYKEYEEVALIYKIDKIENIAYGIVQFPDFSVFVRAKKEAGPDYPFNVSSPNHMMGLVFQFTMALAEVEERLGVNQLEYTKKFFRQQ
jgi:hypothetical protein